VTSTWRAQPSSAPRSLILRRDPVRAAARLEEVHGEMREAAARGDYTALSDADLRFHEVLVAESGSPRLMRMHATLLVESRMCMTALPDTYGLPDEVVEEHRTFVEAIRAGDETRLFERIEAHMQDALRRLTPPPGADDQREVAPQATRRSTRRTRGPAPG
jgi:DNA-binding GntR family transcriptional regulator